MKKLYLSHVHPISGFRSYMVLSFGSNTAFPNKIMQDSNCLCFFNLSMPRKEETAMTKMKQVVHPYSKVANLGKFDYLYGNLHLTAARD